MRMTGAEVLCRAPQAMLYAAGVANAMRPKKYAYSEVSNRRNQAIVVWELCWFARSAWICIICSIRLEVATLTVPEDVPEPVEAPEAVELSDGGEVVVDSVDPLAYVRVVVEVPFEF